MPSAPLSSTFDANGALWGASAADWASIQERTCLPVYWESFKRLDLNSSHSYLDVGCGAGLAAELASERQARIHGIDAAQNLLAIARQRVPAGDFRHGDIQVLPFADGSFDIVTGFNSFQYAADVKVALLEARRVTRRDGKVLIMTWGEPQNMQAAALIAALRPLLPAPPPGAPGPFALSNQAALVSLAESAGLKSQEVFDVDCPWHYPDLDHALRGLRSSGVAARAIGNSSVAAVDDAHAKALEPFRRADGSYVIGAVFRCLIATPIAF